MSNFLRKIKKQKEKQNSKKELNYSTSCNEKMFSLVSGSEKEIDEFFENDFSEELYLKSFALNKKKKKNIKEKVICVAKRIPKVLSDKQKVRKNRLDSYCLDLLKKKNLYYLRKPFMVLFSEEFGLHGMSKKKIMQAFYTQERIIIKEVLESYLDKYSIDYEPYKKDNSKERVRRFREKKLELKKGERHDIKIDI